jgi:nucleoside-diphosphate-sugar epimerase
MKVLVTGASGYVGGAIADTFRANKHEVISLSRRPCKSPWHEYSLGDNLNNIPWQDCQVLIHAAHDFTAKTSAENLSRNILPALELFEAAAASGVSRLVFISSMSSFSGCCSEYGKAKLEIEQRLLHLNPIIIRPGLVWGGKTGGIMSALEAIVIRLPLVPYLSGREKLYQYLVHRDDLANTIMDISETSPPSLPQLITAYHPQPLSILEILKIHAATHSKKRIYFPIPWQLAMFGLKTLEFLGLPAPFRSDSLRGLVHTNPSPQKTFQPESFRPFAP